MKLGKLTERLGGDLTGSDGLEIHGVATLDEAGESDVSFLTDIRYVSQVSRSGAGAILVGRDFNGDSPAALVRVDDVAAALDNVLVWFAPKADEPEVGIHPTALVNSNCRIGREVAIGAYVQIGENTEIGDGSVMGVGSVIGRDVRIGKNCWLAANVVVQQRCVLGNRVILHAHCAIGFDGFGYRMVEGQHRKIPHIGTVEIGDDVEIGANSCVDRAKFGKTVVGRGTKIDNLVQIGHNTRIGEHCLVASQTGISGSCELGRYVILGGQCGLGDHLKLGDGVTAGGRTGITKNIPAGQKIAGFPARDFRQYCHDLAQVKKIARLEKEIQELREQIDQHGQTKDHN